MPGSTVVHRAACLLAVAALCVLFLPRLATADSADVGIRAFSGNAVCISGSGEGGAITHFHFFDLGTDLTAVRWSLTTKPFDRSGVGYYSIAKGPTFLPGYYRGDRNTWKLDRNDGSNHGPVATPEPSSVALLALGLLAFFTVRRRSSVERLRSMRSS
ncbi:MAG: PEP-CTERM sorting domain-containing protein [Candidatus Acidiferrales bacterium]